jgi:hypothetical protein
MRVSLASAGWPRCYLRESNGAAQPWGMALRGAGSGIYTGPAEADALVPAVVSKGVRQSCGGAA